MSSKQQTLLGLLAVAALAVLGFYTLFLADVNLFGKSIQLVVQFPSAKNLREGDPVNVAGLRVGRVKSLSFDAQAPIEKRITVVLNLDQEVPLFEDYKIAIKESTLLGGRNVSILPGVSAARPLELKPGMILLGQAGTNSMDSIESFAELLDENRASISRIVSNLERASTDVAEGNGLLGRLISDASLADEVTAGVADFRSVAADARAISARLEAGEGSLGQLLASDEMYQSLQDTVDSLRRIAAGAEAGEGLVGKLLGDPELAAEFDRTLRNIAGLTDDLKAGRGTVGRLFQDDSVAKNIEAVTGDAATITAKIVAGEGTLGGLWADDDVFQSFKSLGERLDRIAASLEEGNGTVARLLNDEEMYTELMNTVKLLNASLEDYREAAPVSTFTTALFNVF
ncbi:MAG: MlaD family protein [Planctomycetota bacterium]|nr:MlaD family protein [Planctomycetota bacterium]